VARRVITAAFGRRCIPRLHPNAAAALGTPGASAPSVRRRNYVTDHLAGFAFIVLRLYAAVAAERSNTSRARAR